MLNKDFCFIATTGRSGSYFLESMFNRCCDKSHFATFHGNLPRRLKAGGRHTAKKCLENYFLNLMVRKPHKQTYVECNGAFLEYVALSYGIKEAAFVLSDALEKPARSILLVRHPFGYVASIKAKPWAWDWQKMPFFETVHCKRATWNRLDDVGKAAKAWATKNRFFLSLTVDDDCLVVKFEDLFEDSREKYLETVKAVCDHFGLRVLLNDADLAQMQHQKVAAKNKGAVKLTTAERGKVLGICKDVTEVLGYA
jgi:hypothetical protein